MTDRKSTGGRYRKSRKKRKHELPREPRDTKLGEEKKKKIRVRGGDEKTVLLSTDRCNLVAGEKTKEVKIKNVLETPSDKFLARRNIIRKGAIIDTGEGKARVTNRPSQEGNVQAVLVD